MHFIKLSSLCLAIAGMLIGAFSFANENEHEHGLLDPSLDQPLPQYQSPNSQGSSESLKVEAPKARVDQPRTTSKPASDRSTELAPNPLQRLLSEQATEEQPSPSDFESEEPGSIESDVEPAKEAKPFERAPIIEKLPAEEPKKQVALSSIGAPQNVNPVFKDLPKVNQPSLQSKPKQVQNSKTTKSAKKKTGPSPRQPVLNFNVYRDQTVYPLDPRKPNNPCTQNCGGCAQCAPGLRGRPYQPTEPGGYACGKNCSNKRPQFSAYWPRPFSAKCDERDPAGAEARYSGCQQKKLTDCFDRLANFRLIDYQRTDNGYCGPGSDPYGCLGESKTVGQKYPAVRQAYPMQDQPSGFSYPVQ